MYWWHSWLRDDRARRHSERDRTVRALFRQYRQWPVRFDPVSIDFVSNKSQQVHYRQCRCESEMTSDWWQSIEIVELERMLRYVGEHETTSTKLLELNRRSEVLARVHLLCKFESLRSERQCQSRFFLYVWHLFLEQMVFIHRYRNWTKDYMILFLSFLFLHFNHGPFTCGGLRIRRCSLLFA